ncbi:MAG: TonB-dependent receptor [Gemmatimonadales bacterium]
MITNLWLRRRQDQFFRPRPLALAATLLLMATPASAQSIARGTMEGVVTDTTGQPFAGALIWVRETASGVTWTRTSDKAGHFRVPLLPPGNYVITFEELGFQPVRLDSVPVRPGHTQRVSMTLRPVEPPVQEVSSAAFDRPTERSRAGASQWFSDFEINDLPDERRELSELARLSSVSNKRLATERLPGWLSGYAIDGVLYAPVRHADLPPSLFAAEALPISEFETAELFTNAVDVEYSEFAGAYLSGQTRRGTARTEVRAYGDWSGGPATVSDYFTGSDVGGNSFRLGGVLSGPMIRDTAHFVLGIEAQRLETPLPPAWAIETFNSQLLSIADGYGVDIRPYTLPRLAVSKLGSAFGRLDWQITQNHAVSARGSLGVLETGNAGDGGDDPGLPPSQIASLGSKLSGLDLAGGATLASTLSSLVSNELRVGVERSDRDYDPTDPTGTLILDGGLAFGQDPLLPAEFKRFAVRASETLHLNLGAHQLKGGVSGLYTSFEQRYTFARDGLFAFGGTDEFAGLRGAYIEATGSAPVAKFRNWQIGLYVQDFWTAAPGLDVTLGLRYEREDLDRDAVRLNQVWLARTGLDNTRFDYKLDKLSPRFGFLWDVSQRGEWLVRGAAGIYHNLVTSAVFGELVAQEGSIGTRRGLGVLDSWPDAPGLAAAPTVGPRLTLLGPDFGPPRTGRTSLGLSRLFGDGTAFHISGSYRYTDFLPRRKDINLAQSPSGQDQYGRPIYGTLAKEGSLLASEPGSNRRFPDYSLVSALDADGVSKYWDATVRIERPVGGWLDLLAAYTLSWGEDNWLSPNNGGPELELSPFPSGLNGTDWTTGNSDFDIPHRALLAAQAKLESDVMSLRIAGFYRFESGVPFTPGFRVGVDVNGDGSGRNDPAFIDETIPGTDELMGDWECLADQAGRFAERNSCRGPSLHVLDARAAIGFLRLQGHRVEIVVDALNLLDADVGTRDAALYLIDGAQDLAIAADGTVTVPLVTNPNFGEALSHYGSGRAFRFGFRIGL